MDLEHGTEKQLAAALRDKAGPRPGGGEGRAEPQGRGSASAAKLSVRALLPHIPIMKAVNLPPKPQHLARPEPRG